MKKKTDNSKQVLENISTIKRPSSENRSNLSPPSRPPPLLHRAGGGKNYLELPESGKTGGINAKRWGKESRAFTLDIDVSISSGSLGAL